VACSGSLLLVHVSSAKAQSVIFCESQPITYFSSPLYVMFSSGYHSSYVNIRFDFFSNKLVIFDGVRLCWTLVTLHEQLCRGFRRNRIFPRRAFSHTLGQLEIGLIGSVVRVYACVHLWEISRNCSVKVSILGMRKRSLEKNATPCLNKKRQTIKKGTFNTLHRTEFR